MKLLRPLTDAPPTASPAARTSVTRAFPAALPPPPPGFGLLAEIAAHCRRLAEMVVAFGLHLELAPEQLEMLQAGALLHDIGKHAIPPDVLLKRSPLTPAEFSIVREHPVVGESMCLGASLPAEVTAIVRHHHERLDGSGYPDGIGGPEIGLLPQMVGIVDVYDALCHPRAYKPALDSPTACRMLEREALRGWRDRELVVAFTAFVLSEPASATAGVHRESASHFPELHVEDLVALVAPA